MVSNSILPIFDDADCDYIVDRFCKYDKSYLKYDQQLVLPDNILTQDDILLARNVGAIIFPSTVNDLMLKLQQINSTLALIVPNISIYDTYTDIPWFDIATLFRISRVPYFAAANITKVFHKKRPNLIPILDSVVENLLEPLHLIRYSGPDLTEDQLMVEYMKIFKQIADANKTILSGLSRKYQVSEVRVLDILIWSIFAKKKWLSPSYSGSTSKKLAGNNSSLAIHEMALEAFIKNGCVPVSRSKLHQIACGFYGAMDIDSFLLADWTVNEKSGYEKDKKTGKYKDKRHKIFYKRNGKFILYDPMIHGSWYRDDSGCHRINSYRYLGST